MPSGGATPIKYEDNWEYVEKTFEEACKHGLQYEWLMYFTGGLYYNKMTPSEAAYAAAIEWDF